MFRLEKLESSLKLRDPLIKSDNSYILQALRAER